MLRKILIISTIFMLMPLTASNRVLEQDLDKPITVFIHGTLFSAYSWLVNLIDCPRGFYPVTQLRRTLVISKVPEILNHADAQQFPLDSFYLFGWRGYLSFADRTAAARQLYFALKKHRGPITVIGQSHGCNVALNLAQVAQEVGDSNFRIDRLVLLSGPVQVCNAYCVASPIFKKVYALYSTADLIQRGDPQGLYKETKEFCKKNNKRVPFFSQRTFPAAPNLTQARIIINKRSPSHIDFMLEKVLRHLPAILGHLDNAVELAESISEDNLEKHYCVNITYKKRRGFAQYRVSSLS